MAIPLKPYDWVLIAAFPVGLFVLLLYVADFNADPETAGVPMTPLQGARFYSILFGVLYIPFTAMVLRNVDFCAPLRYLYSLTVVPVFMFLLTMAMHLYFHAYPEWIDSPSARDNPLPFTIMTAGSTALLCMGWHWVVARLDRWLRGAGREGEGGAEPPPS